MVWINIDLDQKYFLPDFRGCVSIVFGFWAAVKKVNALLTSPSSVTFLHTRWELVGTSVFPLPSGTSQGQA